jgi:hypothetical protein
LTLNGLHCVISQKLILFITTALKTSNPAEYEEFYVSLLAYASTDVIHPNRFLASDLQQRILRSRA